MEIGIAFDLRAAGDGAGPPDRYEEFDSPATIESVAEALRSDGHGVRLLGGGRELLHELLERPPELVFNMAEGWGTRSREAHVPAVCELLGLAYTGSDPLTLAAALDKSVAKRLFAAAGVPTPRWQVVERADDAVELAFPVIAKPLAEGSSIGIRISSRIAAPGELRGDLERLLGDYEQPVLVEEFCPGPEFTVGILGTGDRAKALGVMEIASTRTAPEEFVYSLEVKHDPTAAETRVPHDRPPALLQLVIAAALAAYRALGCRDVARVDLRLDAAGGPQVLEVNPLPGLKPGWSDLALLAEANGLTYPGLVGAIVAGARERNAL